MGSRLGGIGKWASKMWAEIFDQSGASWTYTTFTTFTAPSPGSTISITFSTTAWMVPGIYIYLVGSSYTNGSFYQVQSVTDSTHAVCRNSAPAGYTNPTGSITGNNALVAWQQPVTASTDATTNEALTIVEANSGNLNQPNFLAVDSAGVTRFAILPTGGIRTRDSLRVYNSVGGSYAALNGAQSVPCIELPDGTGQGSKIWMGSGAPDSTVVGTPAKGDYYLCRSSIACIAASYATSLKTLSIGAGTLTHGTAVLSGTVQAGDLIVAVCADHATQTTLSSPSSANGITATATDGGFTATVAGASEHVYMWSHVVQAADVSAGQVQLALTTNAVGTGVFFAYVFRHPNGWPTTGSFFGCPLSGTPVSGGTSTANSNPITLTLGGTVTLPTATVAGYSGSAGVFSSTGVWGNGLNNSTNLNFPDLPQTVGGDAWVCAKPGVGANASGQSCMPTGEASLVITPSTSAASTAGLAAWSPNSTPSSTLNPKWYVYTGSAWTLVI